MQSNNHLIFTMGFPVLVRGHLYIELWPRSLWKLIGLGPRDWHELWTLIMSAACPERHCGYQTGSAWLSINHYSDVIMGVMASQITSLTIVYSTIYSGADQRKHQSSVSLAFVKRIHQLPVNSPLKGTVMWKMFQFDNIIMMKTYQPRTEGLTWIANTDHAWCLSHKASFLSIQIGLIHGLRINWKFISGERAWPSIESQNSIEGLYFWGPFNFNHSMDK